MAKIGVLGPWVAKYNNINGVVSYSDGRKLAKTTEFSAEPDDTSDPDDFYADNGIAETDRGGSGAGSITNSVDHFDQEGSLFILGIKQETVTIGEKEVTELVYDDDSNPGYLGYGIIIKKRKDGSDLWRAVVYTKMMYSIPADAATTQGETIEWQAEELNATYMRDDTPKRRWKRESTFASVDDAIKYVEFCLNIQGLGELAVTSVAGAEMGDTAITVTPGLAPGHSYKYVIAADVGLPSYDQVIADGYTVWDGESNITAASGQKILVVEVDADNKAKKAGIATIVSREE